MLDVREYALIQYNTSARPTVGIFLYLRRTMKMNGYHGPDQIEYEGCRDMSFSFIPCLLAHFSSSKTRIAP